MQENHNAPNKRQPRHAEAAPNLVVAMSSDRGPIALVAILVERLALPDTAHHLNG